MNPARPPRPPEPGSPGYLATADQLHAAIEDARRQTAALAVASDAVLVGTAGPWAAGMLDSTAPGRGRRVVCLHLGRRPVGPAPMVVMRPRSLVCIECVAVIADVERATPPPCHLCGGPPLSGPIRVVLAQRGHVIARGRLCPPCLFAELQANR